MNEETLFAEALGMNGDARAAFLDEHCKVDIELRKRLEALLRASDHPDPFLEAPAPDARATVDELISERPGTMIGPYKLLQQLGEGGMGVVFLAEQTQPVQRKVALKVIKPGMDSRQVIARFEAERQALAMMDHVNIARVLDAGATDSGKPYFVMELVNGVPITKYCDDNHLTPRARLELFVPVCQAIQHAHQKGIIHRDIKPSNVMVTLYDGKPVPKVIDFGVAKATEQNLADRTLFTQHGTAVGTLEYMSPEQAETSALGVDTRSDVYSLGVLLYELLTGGTPLTRKQIKEAAFGEILRIIKEEEAQKPSTRLSDSGEALASISAQRNTEPAKLTKLVRGELDWIVLKTLEKDRNRRYESASAFAADVRRYLDDEPVQACPPSVGYRYSKMYRRNRGLVLAASIIALSLIAGIIGTSCGLIWADNARRAETERAEGERLAKVAAHEAEQSARESEADTRAFSNFLVNDVLSSARPEGERGGLGIQVTVRKALEAAQEKIEATFRDRPRSEAVARHDLGVTFRVLGELHLAEPHLRRAVALRQQVLGRDHIDTLKSQNSLGVLLIEMGMYTEGVRLYEETLELQRAKLGADHDETIITMDNLANAYTAAGHVDLAIPRHLEVIEFRKRKQGPDHPDTLGSINNLATDYLVAGKVDLALPLLQEALRLMREKQGPDHTATLKCMNNLAQGYQAAGKLDLAQTTLVEALKVQKAKLNADHPDTLVSMNNLGSCYVAARKLHLAVPLLKETLALMKVKLGLDHPNTLKCMNNLASGYQADGKPGLALPLMRETLELTQAKLGPDHPDTLNCMNSLARLHWMMHQFDQSIPIFEKALDIAKIKRGLNDYITISTAFNLGVNYKDAGRFDVAERLFDEWLPRGRVVLSPGNSTLEMAMVAAGESYTRAGYYDKAEPLLREAFESSKKSHGATAPRAVSALFYLCANLLQQKKYEEAEQPLRELLIFGEKEHPRAPITANAQSLLGGSLLGQKKYAEAEQPLLRSYETMKQPDEKLSPRGRVLLIELVERLVQLYDGWGKPEEAAKWRTRLPGAKSAKPATTRKD